MRAHVDGQSLRACPGATGQEWGNLVQMCCQGTENIFECCLADPRVVSENMMETFLADPTLSGNAGYFARQITPFATLDNVVRIAQCGSIGQRSLGWEHPPGFDKSQSNKPSNRMSGEMERRGLG